VSSTARIVPASDLYALIGVRDPYFALREVAVSADGVEAEIPVELKSPREPTCITAAEAARHMGLLAQCAAAEVNPKRAIHYYLTREATLERGPGLLETNGKKLEARGQAELTGPTSATGRITLHDRAGALLYTLRIEFSVLDQKAFERIFSGIKRDLRRITRPPLGEIRSTGELRTIRTNPYGAPLQLRNMDQSGSGDVAEAVLGPIDAASCTGHYPQHPVLPTGIVMSAMSQLCGELLCRRMGKEVEYAVRHAAASADNLAVIGETVHFDARYVSGSSKTRLFECSAQAGTKSVGDCSLTLTVL
jgi:hypothetical protein